MLHKSSDSAEHQHAKKCAFQQIDFHSTNCGNVCVNVCVTREDFMGQIVGLQKLLLATQVAKQ